MFLRFLLRYLGNQRGEVPASTEGESGESQASTEDQTGAATEAQQQSVEESFIDPKNLPEELKPHWKRMHSAFTNGMAKIKQEKEKISAYDQFMTNPEYARQTIIANAQKLGLTVTEAQVAANYMAANAQDGQRQAPTADVPPELVEAARAKLDPSMHWAADQIAAGSWAILKPVLQVFQQDRQAKQQENYSALEQELSEKVPGWEAHEDAMKQIEDFIADRSKLRHPVLGSRKELLYKFATGGARATQEAINRINQAAKNKSSVGSTGRQSLPDVREKIRGAKTEQEAFQIAIDAAKQEIAAS